MKDHRIKVKYLSGLNILLEELLESFRSNVLPATEASTLLDAYRQYMGLDISGMGIAGIVDHFPYNVNRMLLGENSVFFENPALDSKPGRVFLRNEILNQIWGAEVIVGDRTIDVHIRKIRQKLGVDCITTVKGVGYKFDI